MPERSLLVMAEQLDTSLSAREWLTKINALPLQKTVKIMNVCGGHERAISQAGIRGALNPLIELIPGPGCPVCVCPEEDIYQAIQLALYEDVILTAFGDMLRVPVNAKKTQARSLEQARAMGGDVRPVASPLQVKQIAQNNPGRTVVFFVAGFETTTAPVAAMLREGVPDNLLLLLSARLTWPAVAMLLDSDTPGFDALIAPGHVSTVMGANEWRFVTEKHHIPAAVSGFTPESLLAGIWSVLRQTLEKRVFLDNCYPQLVRPEGNLLAQQHLADTLSIYDANWRGVGIIPASGYMLNEKYQHLDVGARFPDYREQARKHAGEMPPGCDCAKVVLGRIYPNECVLFGKACTPSNPVGPCMVSDEGACRIWMTYNSGKRSKKVEAS